DLLHIHALFSFVSVTAARAARGAGIPYVIRPLGVLNHYGMTKRRAMLKLVSFSTIEGPLLKNAAAVQFTSQTEQTEAEALRAEMRGVVIPLGIEESEPGNPDEFLECYPALRTKQRIVFLSRIDPKKNVEGLLHAFALLKDEFPNLALIVCGDG